MIFYFCNEIAVTAVDSATKALKFLGLAEDVASEIHQVYFQTKLHNIYGLKFLFDKFVLIFIFCLQVCIDL
jgi:VanZ family protein